MHNYLIQKQQLVNKNYNFFMNLTGVFGLDGSYCSVLLLEKVKIRKSRTDLHLYTISSFHAPLCSSCS